MFPVFAHYDSGDSGLYSGCGRGGGGGGANMNLPPQRKWFLGHFGLESGIVFEGTTGVCERKKKSPDGRLVCIVLIPSERTK